MREEAPRWLDDKGRPKEEARRADATGAELPGWTDRPQPCQELSTPLAAFLALERERQWDTGLKKPRPLPITERAFLAWCELRGWTSRVAMLQVWSIVWRLDDLWRDHLTENASAGEGLPSLANEYAKEQAGEGW